MKNDIQHNMNDRVLKIKKRIVDKLASETFERFRWAEDKEHSLLEKGYSNDYGEEDHNETVWVNKKDDILLLLNWVEGVFYAYTGATHSKSARLMEIEETFLDKDRWDEMEDELAKFQYLPLTSTDKIWIPTKYPYETLLVLEPLRRNISFYELLGVYELDGSEKDVSRSNEESFRDMKKIDNWIK